MSKQKNKTYILVFLMVLGLDILLPYSWRSSVISSFGDMLGYVLFLRVLYVAVKTKKLQIEKGTLQIAKVVIIWLSISVFNSIRFHSIFGTIKGQDTFDAILGSSYFHIYNTLLFIAYVYIINNTTNSKIAIQKAMDVLVWLQLITGISQFLFINGVPLISEIYDALNSSQILCTSSFIIRMSRITMTGSEPAAMGSSLGILTIPYLLSCYQIQGHPLIRRKIVAKIAILLILAFNTKSSTVYVVLGSLILVLICLQIARSHWKKKIISLIIVVLITVTLISGMVLAYTAISTNRSIGEVLSENEILTQINYYLFTKTTNTNDMSTMHRMSATINDLAILKEHLLLGVGDGNQGFSYADNLPSYMLINEKTVAYARGDYGVVNGGAWFFAVCSGFGLLGVFVLILWIKNYYYPAICKKKHTDIFLYRWFIYALPGLALTLTNGSMSTVCVFVLSIPFWRSAESADTINYMELRKT